jgi:twinkle protein
MDHIRPPDMSLTEYTGFAIKQFKKFGKRMNVHVVVVAHPAKLRRNDSGSYPIPTPYDISDSAHWYNKPDVIIVVHRTGDGPDDTKTLIRTSKSRYHDEIGKPGDVEALFDPETGRYNPIEDTKNSRPSYGDPPPDQIEG